MAKNQNLNSAARAKNDEFYTQFDDIQREMNCYYLYDKNFLRGKTVLLPCDDPEWSNFTKFFAMNFELYGLKKLISTSYAADKKKFIYKPMRSLFDEFDDWSEPQFDASKDFYHGRIYSLEQKDLAAVDYPLKALQRWEYLEGDGDFRSAEVKALRDEADVIITNPPFSMFREFLAWIMEADKKFLIIANKNCITYKEIFPLFMQNKIWVGAMPMGRELLFSVPKDVEEIFLEEEAGSKYRVVKGEIFARSTSIWLTNLEHGKRHRPLDLMTKADCELCHPKVHGVGFQKYDNYDAIEVPATDAIPKDYAGVMGVPITFLDKYCPEQFEIIGKSDDFAKAVIVDGKLKKNPGRFYVKGKRMYDRILIRRR